LILLHILREYIVLTDVGQLIVRIWAKNTHHPHDKWVGRQEPVGGIALVYTQVYTDLENRVLTTMYIVEYTRWLGEFVIT